MTNVNPAESPLQAAAGAAGPHTVEALQILGHETRLAILLALWEFHDPAGDEHEVSFSTLYDRIEYVDTGNFNYHLQQLTGQFIKDTGTGYALKQAGLRILYAIIAGTGLGRRTLSPTEIDMECYHCGAPVLIEYEDERLRWFCTDCDGNYGEESPSELPVGTLMAFSLNPSALADRSPGTLSVVGSLTAFKNVELMNRGVCSECAGPVDTSVRICEDHDASPVDTCENCGSRDEVRVRYVCSVCKQYGKYSAPAAIHGHPAVVSFCYEHGIERTFDLDDPAACGRFWHHLYQRDYTLVSTDPVRIRVTVPAENAELRVTLDADLEVLDITETAA